MTAEYEVRQEVCDKCTSNLIHTVDSFSHVVDCVICGFNNLGSSNALIPTETSSKEYPEYADSYRELGTGVLTQAVLEEGVEYLYTPDGRWWLEVLNLSEDWVIEQCIELSEKAS